MDQQNSTPEKSNTHNNKNLFIALGVCAFVIVVALIGLFMALGSRSEVTTQKNSDGMSDPATAPQGVLTVGNYPYRFACSALSREDIKKVSDNLLPDNMNDERFTEKQATPYNQTPSDRRDLLKTIEDPLLAGGSSPASVESKCEFTIAPLASDSRKSVELSVKQFKSASEAKRSFMNRASYTKGAPFASLKGMSLINGEDRKIDPSYPDTVESYILVNNALVELTYGLGNITPDQAATKLDSLAVQIKKNLEGDSAATKPHSFTGITTNGSTKFVDACNAFDFSKASSIYGDVTYDQTKVDGDHQYGKDSSYGGDTLTSSCNVQFRYKEDGSKQPDVKTQKFTETGSRFPNTFTIEITMYPTAAAATAAVQENKAQLPRRSLLTPVDFTYGNASLAFTQDTTFNKVKSTAHHYKVAKGGMVIDFSIDQAELTAPYTSTVKTITTEQAKRLFDSLKLN